jgi:hypothetical protein
MGGFVVGVRLMAGPGALPEFSRRNLVGDLHLVPTGNSEWLLPSEGV